MVALVGAAAAFAPDDRLLGAALEGLRGDSSLALLLFPLRGLLEVRWSANGLALVHSMCDIVSWGGFLAKINCIECCCELKKRFEERV